MTEPKPPAKRSRRTRGATAYLFALAVLCQLLMPYTGAWAAAWVGSDGAEGAVVLCTPAGLVSVSPDTGPAAPHGSPAACEFCQICQPGGFQAALSAHPLGLGIFAKPYLAALDESKSDRLWLRPDLKQRPVRAPPYKA